MSRWSFVRWLPAVFAPCALFVLSSTAAQTQRTAHSADERLRALSTEEWNWRRKELGQDADQQADAAHLPRVDAASQQARLAYWNPDAGGAGRGAVRPALGWREGERANLPYLDSRIVASDQSALRAEAATVIRDVVAPAYAKLLSMIQSEYLPGARTTLAAVAMPDGEAYYQAMIEKFTTLDLTAKEIHEIGLKEVARIEAEMQATKERANFKGTMAEFLHFLRTDPHFYARTPRELLSYAAYVSKKADAALSEHEITTEVERYIAWPGQALAYKLGELQIRRHRREAEQKLGARFDQRSFHDAILAIGSVPLPVLEQRMNQFIADGGVNPSATPSR